MLAYKGVRVAAGNPQAHWPIPAQTVCSFGNLLVADWTELGSFPAGCFAGSLDHDLRDIATHADRGGDAGCAAVFLLSSQQDKRSIHWRDGGGQFGSDSGRLPLEQDSVSGGQFCDFAAALLSESEFADAGHWVLPDWQVCAGLVRCDDCSDFRQVASLVDLPGTAGQNPVGQLRDTTMHCTLLSHSALHQRVTQVLDRSQSQPGRGIAQKHGQNESSGLRTHRGHSPKTILLASDCSHQI